MFFLVFTCVSFVLRVSSNSFFSRAISFDNTDIIQSVITDKQSVMLYTCARLCHGNMKCLSFVYNHHDGKCRLLNKLFFSRQSDVMITNQGNIMFKKVEDDAFCELPVIDKGRLLSTDGLSKESNASMVCDDFHFPSVFHIQCGEDGTWAGLDDQCVHMGNPFSFLTRGRIAEGGCVVVIAAPYDMSFWSVMVLRERTYWNQMLHISFRFNRNELVWATKFNDVWFAKHTTPFNWSLGEPDANLTLCITAESYIFYIDNEEKFNFEHHLPFEDVDDIYFRNLRLRKIEFM